MRTLTLPVLVLVTLTVASPAPAARPDAEAVRQAVGPAVCTVTVENGWGVTQSVTTGWLLGDGRFAVADLGALRARGAARATLTFADGAKSTADQFGMADPALGLAVLQVQSPGGRKGLPLAAEPPALGQAVLVSMAGYEWGERLEVRAGRLLPGPKIETVATRSGVTPPAGVEGFLRIEGDRLRAASGAPVTDADGRVLAVRLDVDAKGLTSVLAMPATTLRSSLLSATPELKPLTALPEPFWPVRLLRLPGEPVGLETFVKASQAMTRTLVCDRCRGKGEIDPGGWMYTRNIPCPFCLGTGIRITPENLEGLNEWALQGTRVAWAPDIDARTRAQVRKIGVEMLARLAPVGRNLRRAIGFLGNLNTVQLKGGRPQGAILYAQVTDQVEGPDGQYLVLDAYNSRTPVTVRVEDLLGHDGRGPLPGRQVPGRGTWFALAATVVSEFNTGEVRGMYVLPFEWAPYIPSMDPNEDDRDRRGPPRDDWRDRLDDWRDRRDDWRDRGGPGGFGGRGR
jgi:hypothetical protein